MGGKDIRRSSDLNASHALRAILKDVGMIIHDEPNSTEDPLGTLQSALGALHDGRISAVVEQLDENVKFKDHALELEFTGKPRVKEFFLKTRELFPDTELEVVSLMGSGEHAIAEWKLTATQTVPSGAISYRFRISAYGMTIVRIEQGKIVEWSDYYDQIAARRTNLAALFTEWFEY